MESDDISESPSTKLAANKDDANAGPAAAVPSSPGLESDHNREVGENSAGKGDLQEDQDLMGGGEGLSDGGSGEGEEGDSDLEDEEGSSDDNELEYDDEDMFFDQHFEPVPSALHRINSMREPMGEEGGRRKEGVEGGKN